MKKYILGLIISLTAPVLLAYASTPVLSVSGTGDTVTVQVTDGEINAPVVLFYNQTGGNVQQHNIGSTDINGNFNGSVSTSALGITQVSPVYVQVGGYQSLPVNWSSAVASATSTGAVITFSPASPTLAVGQSGTVTLSGGGNGTYYITSNSNPNWTSANISGNTLTISGSQAGQTTLTVCSTAGSCAVVTPVFSAVATSTTGGTTGTAGAPTVNQSSLNLGVGGQGTLMLSGGTSPYAVSFLSGNNVSTTLIGNTLYVTGSASGTAVLNVCSQQSSAGSNLCTPVTVNVSGSGTGSGTGTTTGSTTGITFSLPISAGEAARLSLSGGTGSYYVQPMTGSTVNTTVNGNTLTITGLSQGYATVNVCSGANTSTAAAVCTPIIVSVGPALTGTGGGYLFDMNLYRGMSGQDVMELQQRLREEGYFNTTATGYFGPLTMSAVKAYQIAHGLPAVGVVGPQTRALLNQ